MKYRNKVTGVVIETVTKITGPNWEPVTKAEKKPAKVEKVEEPIEEPKPKATKKKASTKRGKKK